VERIFKVSGAGNDFLALIEPARDPTRDEVLAWCARGFALGADGVFVLRRAGDGAVEMSHWNADGRPVEQCLNATRCAARLAFELGWAGERIPIATGAGVVIGRRAARPATAAIDVLPPQRPVVPCEPLIDGHAHPGFATRVGVPHFVIVESRSLAEVPVAALGPLLRRHPDFGAAGTNVDWVRFVAPDRMEIRSFERGVEAETLACGTGILAALAVGLRQRLAALRVTAVVLGGFELEAEARVEQGVLTGFTLAGDARIVAALELAPDARRPLPPPPRWS
jgi:diaminopimelate epimerase